MFDGKICQQKLGAAMGSPVSPIVANLFIEDLEEKANNTAPKECWPKLWKKYVDDVLEVIPRGILTEHLN